MHACCININYHYIKLLQNACRFASQSKVILHFVVTEHQQVYSYGEHL